MRTAIDFIATNWVSIAIPVTVFILALIALFWLRKMAMIYLSKRICKADFAFEYTLFQAIKSPCSLLCIVLSIYLGLAVSSLPPNWKETGGNGLWTLFIIAMALSLLNLVDSFTILYCRKFNLTKPTSALIRNVLRVIILIIAVLIVMELWGAPTSPLLLLLSVVILVGALVFRDSVPNLFAGFQIAATQEIKNGDYVKLENQKEGYVASIGWNSTNLKSLDGSILIVPNIQLIHRDVMNYGHPLKKAAETFHFSTQAQMSEITGLRARTLQEFVANLKIAPDTAIYYHTHHFLEEKQNMISEMSNDFAVWVNDEVENKELAERLAKINPLVFTSPGNLRDRLVSIIEEYLVTAPEKGQSSAKREFYFMKPINVILPTPYLAHDLREFVEALRQVSSSSINFHIFQSRLSSEKGSNDFSDWLEKSLSETELAREIAQIGSSPQTLEELRSLMVKAIEKRIK